MGVSGDAHTGHTVEVTHCHLPFVHWAICWLQAEPGHDMPGVSQALPSFGMNEGQGADGVGGVSQNQTGVPIGLPWHWAHGGPGGPGLQLQGTHPHLVVPA
jgi:hypothetical protein